MPFTKDLQIGLDDFSDKLECSSSDEEVKLDEIDSGINEVEGRNHINKDIRKSVVRDKFNRS